VIIGSCAFQHRPELGAKTLAARGCKHVKSLECRHRVISHITITCAQSSVGVLKDERAPVIAFEFENLNDVVRDALGLLAAPNAFARRKHASHIRPEPKFPRHHDDVP
jgi:hypothetical protein